MKNYGLLLIVAGIFVILAGIAIYGYIEVGARNAAPADAAAQMQEAGSAALSFDDAYDKLPAGGKGALDGRGAYANFLIRYRLVFAIASGVFLIGGVACVALFARKRKHA